MSVYATEGWHGYVRIKLDNESTNWSNNGSGYAIDPRVSSAPFDTAVGMEKVYVIGNRNAVDTVEGVIDITGSIERNLYKNLSNNQIVWNGSDGGANQTHYSLVDVTGLYGTNVSKCMMLVKPNENTTFVLHGVKFHDYSLSFAQGELTKESASFTVENVSTG